MFCSNVFDSFSISVFLPFSISPFQYFSISPFQFFPISLSVFLPFSISAFSYMLVSAFQDFRVSAFSFSLFFHLFLDIFAHCSYHSKQIEQRYVEDAKQPEAGSVEWCWWSVCFECNSHLDTLLPRPLVTFFCIIDRHGVRLGYI